jgi:DNA ligase D-like protein (predicted 3'-phosphoesterase)
MPGGLQEYEHKRDFRSTGEPKGRNSKGTGGDRRQFVIQQHRSHRQGGRVHFDFRLEIGGVLASWAVPKGPSTDPREKRLAIHVEDHPLDYADFEGVIPEGEYGAGTVVVWDRGPYRNLKEEERSMGQALENGQVEVYLEGRKLRGRYALVRTGSRRSKKDGAGGERGAGQKGSARQERWLLVKMDDEEADARRNPVSTEPKSVLSGRTLDEIAAEEGEDQ